MVASVFVMLIPIIAILTRHQQKMTVLMRQENQHLLGNNEMQVLQHEVQALKAMVSDLAMSVDSLNNEVRSMNRIQDRITVGEA